MNNLICTTIILLFFTSNLFAQEDSTPQTDSILQELQELVEIENSMNYERGTIKLPGANATIVVPKGFKYLNKEQAEYVLVELWGNPKEDNMTLGMILADSGGLMDMNSWSFNIEFDPMGYVSDDDAEDINYDDLLTDIQKEETLMNKERMKLGYEAIHMHNWASKPYYDKNRKILHWAKDLQFGDNPLHTLNYNIRILGRKGVLVVNAIATMDQLEDVKKNIPKIIDCVKFDKGSTYKEFDSSIDEKAAWTIGGLVAGKLLAKAGFFALLVKFWKVIAIAVVAAGSFIWKKIKRNKEEKESDSYKK